jgi:hypothetical protein
MARIQSCTSLLSSHWNRTRRPHWRGASRSNRRSPPRPTMSACARRSKRRSTMSTELRQDRAGQALLRTRARPHTERGRAHIDPEGPSRRRLRPLPRGFRRAVRRPGRLSPVSVFVWVMIGAAMWRACILVRLRRRNHRRVSGGRHRSAGDGLSAAGAGDTASQPAGSRGGAVAHTWVGIALVATYLYGVGRGRQQRGVS